MEPIENLSIRLSLDAENFNGSISQVDRNLKVMGGELKSIKARGEEYGRSVEGLSQKQDVLGRSLDASKIKLTETRKKYDEMVASGKASEAQLERQAKKVNDAQAAYNRLETDLRSVETELKAVEAEVKRQSSSWQQMSDKIGPVGDKLSAAGDKMKGIGQNMSTYVTAPIVAGFAAITKGTEEFRGDMAKLETNAKQAGIGIDAIRESMVRLSGVNEDTNENVEALSNLLAIDFSREGMTKTLDALSGAVIKFPETLKIEGLADGLQETLATGKAIGPFAEMLERMGVNLDTFNEGLAESIKNGTQENFVLQELAKLGLTDVSNAYRKSNEELVKSREASAKFQQSMADLGGKLVPIATTITESISKVTDKFLELNPETQNTIIKVGALAAAIGPLIAIGGSLVAGLGGAITTVSALSGGIAGAGGLTAAIGALAGPVGWTALAIAGLGAGFYALDKAMDEPVVKSDIFKGKISEATQEAVGAYMKLDTDATASLNSLAWSSQTITDTMANNMVTRYQQMGDQVLQAMIQNHEAQLQEQQRLFAESDILNEQEEAKRIAKLQADQLAEVEAHNAHQARIKEIWTTAAAEKRGITEMEAAEIAAIQEQMRVKAVEELSASQQEQETILKNLKDNKGIIETETAAQTVKTSMDTRDAVVKEAEKQYAETVSYAEQGRDDLGTITAEEADAIIAEAERKKNEVTSKASDMHDEVVREAQAQSGDQVDLVNWVTGEVLAKYDQMYNGVLDAVNWIRELFGKEPLSKKGSIQETGRQKLKRQDAEFKAYAAGTKNGLHAGGLALVGELGRELIHEPGVGAYLSGDGPEIRNLRRGASVLPNKETEKLLKSYNFPAYAEGIGDYFEKFMEGADSVWELVKGKFNLSDSIIPDWLNQHTGSPLEYIGTMMKEWIQSLMGDIQSMGGAIGGAIGSVGSGVQRWAGLAAQALMIEGQYSPANLQRLLYQMQTESGGNPRAINLWDSNAKRGTPSMGLLQTIQPTYNRYKHPDYDKGPYDPMSNILASIRYAVARYGTLEKAYRGVGYATGGIIDKEQIALLGEKNKEEVVIPLEQHRERALGLLSYASKKLGMPKNLASPMRKSNEETKENANAAVLLMGLFKNIKVEVVL